MEQDGSALRGRTILIVEDCIETAEALRRMARACGMRARVARSVDAARRHLVAFRPSAVLVDLGLPDGDGATLLRDLADDAPARPALMAMSGDPAALASAGLDGVADARMEKPLAGEALHAALSRLVERMPPCPLAMQGI